MSVMLRGGRVGYNSGDLLNLADDCQILKPTNVPFVPRILNKIYDKMKSEIGNSRVKQFLLHKAIASKEADRLKY
jgi:long-chain acyl-CoA synthetase